MNLIRDQLVEAARARRRVRIRFSYTGEREVEYEREMEPYAIRDGDLVAFSCFRNEFRTLPLSTIISVEISPDTFSPKREIEL
jgi:predicted DNA-binding transcriptional regulator YafY